MLTELTADSQLSDDTLLLNVLGSGDIWRT